MAEHEYQRLTRSKSRSLFGIVSISRSSLWVGRDHLLTIDTTGYNETYKRFYFRDIQAVILRKTAVWLVSLIVLAGCAAVCGSIAVFGGALNGLPAVGWVFGIIAACFVLAAVLDLAGGPTCKFQLRTAVQTEELPAISRVRRARKVLARLRPLLVEAQGTLPPEEIPARLRELQSARP
jgi:hypothetical protein